MAGAETKGAYAPGGPVGEVGLRQALQDLDRPFSVVATADGPAVARGGVASFGRAPGPGELPLLAHVPALTPDQLGDPSFLEDYQVRVAYVAGAMANGIGSERLVVAMARAGMLGFFGAAGLPVARVAEAIDRIRAEAPGLPAGFNLIHSPAEPWREQGVVDLYLQRGVQVVSASAYLGLTPMLVQYRATGLRTGPDGRIEVPNRVLAKVSRAEVAEKFLRPAPAALLRDLVAAGRLSAREAALAAHVPMADDLTAEADSGGHTDNRPAAVLLPVLTALRDAVLEGSDRTVRIGLAGGIATPAAVAGAFAMGAAYVLTGSVNQACIEAGTSDLVRGLLADAGMADVGMAPSSDMFEAGVEVQVLTLGTLFAMRARRLRAVYLAHDGIADIPADERTRLEQRVLGRPLAGIWEDCQRFFEARDPAQLERAARDPRHHMALIFRWYLGQSSRWAIDGDTDRALDLQVWCGPSIGAFNAWTEGSFLADPARRSAVTVGANLMAGAAVRARGQILGHQGIRVDPAALGWRPRPLHTDPLPAERHVH